MRLLRPARKGTLGCQPFGGHLAAAPLAPSSCLRAETEEDSKISESCVLGYRHGNSSRKHILGTGSKKGTTLPSEGACEGRLCPETLHLSRRPAGRGPRLQLGFLGRVTAGVPALPAGHRPAQGLSKGLDPSKDVSAWPTAESVPGNLRIRLCGSDSETPLQGPQWLRMNSHCPPRPGALSPEVGGRALLRRHCPAPLVSRLGLCPQPRPVRVTGIFRWREFPAGGFGGDSPLHMPPRSQGERGSGKTPALGGLGNSSSAGSVHWRRVKARVSPGTQRGGPVLRRGAVSTAGVLAPWAPRADPGTGPAEEWWE